MVMDIGLSKKDREMMAEGLFRVLADTHILSLKTRNYHWNVTGPHFFQFHKLFEVLYKELDEGGDDIAEQIRSLGRYSPASYAEFTHLTALKEEHTVPEALDMVRQLALDNEKVVRRLNEVLDVAEAVEDKGTADLLTCRIRAHTKNAWMLRSHLE